MRAGHEVYEPPTAKYPDMYISEKLRELGALQKIDRHHDGRSKEFYHEEHEGHEEHFG